MHAAWAELQCLVCPKLNCWDFAEIKLEASAVSGLDGYSLWLSADVRKRPRMTFTCTPIDGTATGGVDYDSTVGSVMFAPGEVAKIIEVALLDDTIDEGDDETFNLEITDNTGLLVATAFVFMDWDDYTNPTTGAVTPVAKVYNPWGVIDPNPDNPLNRPNELWISEVDLGAFNRAIALKEN